MNGNNKSVKDFYDTQSTVLYHIDILEQNKNVKHRKLSENDFILLDGWKKPTNSCSSDFQVDLKGQRYTLSEYELIRLDNLSNIPEEYLENATLEDLGRLIGSIITDTAKENLPKVIFWEYKAENLLSDSINIDSFINNPDSCVPLKNMFILSGIEDISTSIQDKREGSTNQFQNYLDGIAAKTTSHFKRVWKDYQNIEFSLKKEHDCIIPGVKEQNTYDFNRRSDGFKRFVTFLLMISARVTTNLLENTLLLVDEAEISLHPSGARHLRDELIKIANKNHVVYSTHSIFMIDSGEIHRHYIVKKENEITTIHEAKDSNIVDEEVLYNALGFSVFEILKEKNIIFEGWKDKELFRKYLENQSEQSKEKFKNIGLCHAKGVKGIKKITPTIELAKRKCLIISDSDEIARQYQKEYKQDKGFGNWKIYQDLDDSINAITAEDFIKNDFITEQINAVLSGREGLNFNGNVLPEKDKLNKVKGWLAQQGVQPGEQKNIIKNIKDLVFDNLKYDNISNEYKNLFDAILSYYSQ